MDKPVFKLEVFEGPLDLLLKLISKHKINIYDIPIALVLDQYMESIEGMKQIDLDVASEFMTMAAYLLYIKSQTLLPRHEEEQEDPRENLVRLLLEYQRYKAVAASLQAFETAKSRSDVVATFLAVLELTSSKRIRLEGEDDAVQITLRRNK